MTEITDVVIVGGGILGTMLAYELTRRTLHVTLLEMHALASGITGSGFGWINATSKTDDEAYHRLNAQSRARYDALAVEWGVEALGIYAGGALYWADGADQEGRAALRSRAALLQGWQYPVAMLRQEELHVLEPAVRFEEGAEGLFAPADRWVDAPRLTRFLAERARRQNAQVREYCPATGFNVSIMGAIAGVQTPEMTIATRWAVLAAGAQTPALAAQMRGFVPERTPLPVERRAGLLVEIPAGAAPGLARRVLYPPDAGGLHLRPTPGGGLLIGADDTDQIVQEAGVIPAAAVHSLLERAARCLPGLDAAAMENAAQPRLCVRPVPADDYPMIGPLPGVRNVFVAVSHSGVTLAPILAQHLCDQIINERMPLEIANYQPARFASSP
jgi:glycine/D-amino acid oxidase-like deaminating enzyme